MDSVLLMVHLKGKAAGSDVHGRDIHSAVNSVDPKIMCDLVCRRGSQEMGESIPSRSKRTE